MESKFFDEKEDVFHDSHTKRYSYYSAVKSPSILIERPEVNESEVITQFYCPFDEYLVENKHSLEHSCRCSNGQVCYNKDRHWIPLMVPHEEVAELLEGACVSKSTEYNNWNNTTSVIYSVPSTYEVDVICAKEIPKPKFASVDGKMYDREMIYRYNLMSHSWQPICHRNIAAPVFKTAMARVDLNTVPLKISTITCNKPESNPTNRDDRLWRRRGILHHGTPWNFAYSMNMIGDVHIDLGQPQIVTHIGTIGSFIQTKWYPEHLNSASSIIYGKNRKARFRRKLSQGILIEDNQCTPSWCASYRLMYKKSVSDAWTHIGSYKANQNSYELVVNDLRTNLPSVPIRYLLLKPISNKPRNFPAYSSCRMSIALYGKAPEVAKKKLAFEDEAKNEVQLIRYTLCVPPVKQVRVKQNHGNCHNWCDYGTESKHITKHRMINDIKKEANGDGFFDCVCMMCWWDPFWFDENASYEDYLDEWEGEWQPPYSTDSCSSTGVWKEVDTRLDDVSMWPPLPTVSASTTTCSWASESESVSTVEESSMDDLCSKDSNAANSDDSEWELI